MTRLDVVLDRPTADRLDALAQELDISIEMLTIHATRLFLRRWEGEVEGLNKKTLNGPRSDANESG